MGVMDQLLVALVTPLTKTGMPLLVVLSP